MNTYNNGPEGMPRVERMTDSTLDSVIRSSKFSPLDSFSGEDRDRLHDLLHEVAEEVLARLPEWPVAPAGVTAPAWEETPHSESAAFQQWWNEKQACPEHNMITQNAAAAAWHERARRAPASSPVVPVGQDDALDAALRKVRARNTLQFDMCFADGMRLKGNFRCSDEQWSRIQTILLEKREAAPETPSQPTKDE